MHSAKTSKVLIVTCQDLHRSDRPSSGGSLRTYTLGEALKERGHQVLYSVPRRSLRESTEIPTDLLRYCHEVVDIGDIIEEVHPNTVIFGNWGLADQAAECDVPTVVDINGSLIIENYFRRQEEVLDDALAKLRALAKVDLILAGSHAQKMYLTAWCLMAGISPKDLAIEVVPFSLSPNLPVPQHANEPIFVMAGYNWPWLDGQHTIEAIGQELAKRGEGHLYIYADSPPYSDILPKEDSSSDKISEFKRGQFSRVSFHEALPYDHLIGVLCKSTVAVDVWGKNIERELAFPTRTVAYLWAGLPVISSPYGGLAELIERYKAGWIIGPDDERRLSELLEKIITNPKQLIRYGQNAQRLIRECLTWDKTIDPLDQFCRLPRKNRSLSPFINLIHNFEHRQQALFHNLELAHKTIETQQQQTKKQSEKSEKMKKQISALCTERDLLSMVHRRPKGFALFASPALGWSILKRFVFGFPVLIYLGMLTSSGQFLERIWNWWRRA